MTCKLVSSIPTGIMIYPNNDERQGADYLTSGTRVKKGRQVVYTDMSNAVTDDWWLA